jgi:hypothetical protein
VVAILGTKEVSNRILTKENLKITQKIQNLPKKSLKINKLKY